MNATWAVRFPPHEFKEAIRLWPYLDVEVCDGSDGANGEVWFRGTPQGDELDLVLRSFLNGKRFRVEPDGQLTSPHQRVPHGRLPEGPWVSLRQWMHLELTSPAFSAQSERTIPWRLTHDDEEPGDAHALITTMPLLRHYASRAPLVRLRPLQFAMDSSGRVVLWGTPLPAIPGTRLMVRDGIGVPCGRTWMPQIPSKAMCHVLGIATGDLAILHEQGTWDHIQQEHFVAVTRESVRASCQEVQP